MSSGNLNYEKVKCRWKMKIYFRALIYPFSEALKLESCAKLLSVQKTKLDFGTDTVICQLHRYKIKYCKYHKLLAHFLQNPFTGDLHI